MQYRIGHAIKPELLDESLHNERSCIQRKDLITNTIDTGQNKIDLTRQLRS